ATTAADGAVTAGTGTLEFDNLDEPVLAITNYDGQEMTIDAMVAQLNAAAVIFLIFPLLF
ncbi:MAG: hypothetical protein IJD06_04100, partial [Clostridia bacterium]|nr:hypothetical protein [Clostridia bacterium]